jgi:hypothetical protein
VLEKTTSDRLLSLDGVEGRVAVGVAAQARAAKKGCHEVNNPACAGGGPPDVMGCHDAREIPNYWRYASNFVLSPGRRP